MLIPKAEQRISQILDFVKKNRYRVVEHLEFDTFETDKTFRSVPEKAAWKKIACPYKYGKPF